MTVFSHHLWPWTLITFSINLKLTYNISFSPGNRHRSPQGSRRSDETGQVRRRNRSRGTIGRHLRQQPSQWDPGGHANGAPTAYQRSAEGLDISNSSSCEVKVPKKINRWRWNRNVSVKQSAQNLKALVWGVLPQTYLAPVIFFILIVHNKLYEYLFLTSKIMLSLLHICVNCCNRFDSMKTRWRYKILTVVL